MDKLEIPNSKLFKIAWVLIVVASIITILNGGYNFGNWLYNLTHQYQLGLQNSPTCPDFFRGKGYN